MRVQRSGRKVKLVNGFRAANTNRQKNVFLVWELGWPYNLAIMRNRNVVRISLVSVLTVACAVLLLPRYTQAQTVSKTATVDAYTVTLKVLPAESFEGPKAEMVRDGGAEASLVNGPAHPNHHMVVFIKKDGKPVENAKVSISYRELSSKSGAWKSLPVARMHVAGKGLATTHYGNNVNMPADNYEVHVTVNGQGPATFHFSL